MTTKIVTVAALSIIVASFGLIQTNAELLDDCQRNENEIMVGTERVLEITYDCSLGSTGEIGVMQQGLTAEEVYVLDKIKMEKQNGSYIQPPIQNSTQIDLQNPICTIVHFSDMLKQQYNCFD